MNILAPYSWLKEYVKTDLPADTYAEQVALIGNEVERRVRADRFLDQVVVGRVVEVKPHPNADKLKIAMTEIAPNDVRQIVCGGTNLAAGQVVPVCLPGATVNWHGTDVMEIKEAKVRGEASYGMICAAEEIGFEKLPQGETEIWDLTALLPDAKVGTPLAEALDLAGEVVFDFDVTTNRVDTMSIVGQAREAYAADLGDFEDPLRAPLEMPAAEETQDVFTLEVRDHDLCPRYMAVALDVEVKPSPWWMQKRLLLAGAKPINNVVDVTNYVRLELGQPLHAFDASKLDGGSIIVRRAEAGEEFVALDESKHKLSADMLVIADAKKPVAIGGVMGGLNSGVSSATTRIVLEAALFDPLSIRKTWRALNLQSDSQTLYEKGLSTELPAYGLVRAVELLKEIASGRVISEVHDERATAYAPRTFTLNKERVTKLVGVEIDPAFQQRTLERLGFALEGTGNEQQATVPFWRDKDIEADIDLTEEIARVYGYANLPSTLPTGAIPRRAADPTLAFEERLKDLLAGHGWTELYADSFVDPADMKRCGLDLGDALQLANPLAEDASVMRTSLMPTLLRTIVENEGRDGLERLFELQRVYLPREGDLPDERPMLQVGLVHHVGGEELFRHAKGTLDLIAGLGHISYTLDRDGVSDQYHPGRSARVMVDGKAIGVIGELHPMVLGAFGIDHAVASLEFDVETLQRVSTLTPTYVEPVVAPPARRDIAMLVGEQVTYETLVTTMKKASALVTDVELFDLYRGSQIPTGKKSLAVHVTLQTEETLTSEQIDQAMHAIAKALNAQGAEIRE